MNKMTSKEALENLSNMGDKDLYNERYLEWTDTLRIYLEKLEEENKELKEVLDILKNKNVDIFCFFDFISLDAYNEANSKDFGINEYNLTKEEYELLNKYLGKEQDNE